MGCFDARRVIWVSDTERNKGYAVDFVAVSLHAVSRDPEAYPSPCIYTQVISYKTVLDNFKLILTYDICG
jgi:hypothetical protein